jgi:CDP-paratose 2-epimerase
LVRQGLDVVGVDNDMRSYFFGAEASTKWSVDRLKSSLGKGYRHFQADIRDKSAIDSLFNELGRDVVAVVHTAAQPSHDWAAKEPETDYSINATGTLVLLEALRRFCPEAAFVFTSTNKVYGDTPNRLPLTELTTRWELNVQHPWSENGIDESMSVDQTKHSLFGASKLAADVLVQEYGRYFGLKTGVFRGGCLTGPAHSGAELHGFLAYLVKCGVTGKPYTVFGYKGKQVRDNIHSEDLVEAFWSFIQSPRAGEVYNIGGSRFSNCSVLEAIQLVESATQKPFQFTVKDDARIGDHIWWISDVSKFQSHYPGWKLRRGMEQIVGEIVEALRRKDRP